MRTAREVGCKTGLEGRAVSIHPIPPLQVFCGSHHGSDCQFWDPQVGPGEDCQWLPVGDPLVCSRCVLGKDGHSGGWEAEGWRIQFHLHLPFLNILSELLGYILFIFPLVTEKVLTDSLLGTLLSPSEEGNSSFLSHYVSWFLPPTSHFLGFSIPISILLFCF